MADFVVDPRVLRDLVDTDIELIEWRRLNDERRRSESPVATSPALPSSVL